MHAFHQFNGAERLAEKVPVGNVDSVIPAYFGADVSGDKQDRYAGFLFPDSNGQIAAVTAWQRHVDDQKIELALCGGKYLESLMKICGDPDGMSLSLECFADGCK